MEKQLDYQTASGNLKHIELNLEKINMQEHISFDIENNISFAVNDSDYSKVRALLNFELVEKESKEIILQIAYETTFQTNNTAYDLPVENIYFVQKLIEYSLMKVSNIVSFISFEAFGKVLEITTKLDDISK